MKFVGWNPGPWFTMDKQAIHFYGLGPILTFTESTVTGWGVYPRNLIKKKRCFLGEGGKSETKTKSIR